MENSYQSPSILFPDSIKNSFLHSLHTCTQFLFPICKINLFLFPIIFFLVLCKKNSIRSLYKRRKGFYLPLSTFLLSYMFQRSFSSFLCITFFICQMLFCFYIFYLVHSLKFVAHFTIQISNLVNFWEKVLKSSIDFEDSLKFSKHNNNILLWRTVIQNWRLFGRFLNCESFFKNTCMFGMNGKINTNEQS